MVICRPRAPPPRNIPVYAYGTNEGLQFKINLYVWHMFLSAALPKDPFVVFYDYKLDPSRLQVRANLG